ncbi:MAG: zinc-binding dehydrogenase [Sideroxydans sp.]|nr:zinc-binding dehydrogenase [Sideroxydans sp.]
MNKFSAYQIIEENGKSTGRFVELQLSDLDAGEVVIRTHFSGVNYKDALAATGAGKVIRRFPCVGGVDAAGVVESSQDARFKAGDQVLVTGYDMGVAHDGGFAEFVRVPADWVVLLRRGAAEPTGAGATASHLLPQTAGFASNVSEVLLRRGAAEPTGAGATASHLLPQTAGFASNVSEVLLPQALTLFDAMALGTAGFTAALSIHRLEQNELTPDKGKVIVTGATGGVGSLAVRMLSQLGYHVVALTGKATEQEYLRSLGATEILLRSEIDFASKRPLESAQWAGALDSVGGDTLPWLLRTMQQNGAIACFGNAGGVELHTSVFPFILRGVKLLGVDSAATQQPLRSEIWQRLAGDLRISNLDQIGHRIAFADLPQACAKLIRNEAHGRSVVEFVAE